MRTLKFVDLFAGLGGFHIALARLGHRCVFAAEADDELRTVYAINFGLQPVGDIRKADLKRIPEHDVLCAGFPCQPFSKAGGQIGLDCPRDGDLFDYIRRILTIHEPQYFLLENVPNLLHHSRGETYSKIRRSLKRLGYDVQERVLSPNQFGVPQIRERLYVVGSKRGLETFVWPQGKDTKSTSIASVLEERPLGTRRVDQKVERCLEVWQQFLQSFPCRVELPSFPVWTMEFGATYPYEETTPFAVGVERLGRFRGTHGTRLSAFDARQRWDALPAYARTKEIEFPKWKQKFISQNRELYRQNKAWLDRWLPLVRSFPPSWQKLEWNCKGERRNIWDYVIQFRASGVRVKRPSAAPSLIAMNTTQVPIIGWERRYMTRWECARLQSLHELRHLPLAEEDAFRALGNAVNADVVEAVARALLPSRLRLVKAVRAPDVKQARKIAA